jgi:glycosyl transferase family 25
MWDFIDKIVYINLDSRQDRRDIMKTFFEKGGIPMEKVIRFPAIKKMRGALGCLESHTEALKMAKQNSWKNVLILEDDLEWLDLQEGYKKLEQLTQMPDWDVIMLVGWYWKYDFPRVYNANNAGAYLVNSSYYNTLLKNRQTSLYNMKQAFGFHFNSTLNDADTSWKVLQKKDKWYGLEPCICRQVDGFSDHCKRIIHASLVYGIGTLEIKKKVYG